MLNNLLIFNVIAVLALITAMAAPAYAQAPPCGSAASIIGAITGVKYQESGLVEMTQGPARFQLYANMKSGTWTLVLYRPDGAACIVAGGNSIEPMGAAKKKDTKS